MMYLHHAGDIIPAPRIKKCVFTLRSLVFSVDNNHFSFTFRLKLSYYLFEHVISKYNFKVLRVYSTFFFLIKIMNLTIRILYKDIITFINSNVETFKLR